MATITSPPAERVILYDVSWETYERLLADTTDRPAPRFTYDRGTLEMLVTLSTEHERIKATLTSVVEIVADERAIDFINVGSMTFRREDLGRGFEPDVCFYIQNEHRVRARRQIDPTVDPPPDLVIEIDISRQSLDKLPVYAGFGVPEVWRVRDGVVTIYTRNVAGPTSYDAGRLSLALPPMNGETLTQFLAESSSGGRSAWVRSVRAWAHQH